MEECYICNFCRKLCKNGNSLRNHERLCKENPERQESSWVKFNHERGAWNKGLTKETDERLLKASKTLSDGYKSGRLINANLGKQHTDEEKKNLSEKRKHKKTFISKKRKIQIKFLIYLIIIQKVIVIQKNTLKKYLIMKRLSINKTIIKSVTF